MSYEMVGCTDLRFIERSLINFLLECFRDRFALQDLVLAEEKPVLECELSKREADYKLLPWEERPVEPAAQALDQFVRQETYQWGLKEDT
jgi:hypothetical protein